ncbi:MAG: hypothetical protein KAZ71_04210 [Bacteroidia bacterium]|nr:hypothetical protein [Bacteroidia bacterium]
MKILGIFKKENKKTAIATTQKLDRNQLEKVIGGAEGDPIPGVGVNLGRGINQAGLK